MMAQIDSMIYKPVKIYTEDDSWEKLEECRNANFAHLKEIEEKAIASGGLLYRFLYESVADGKAIYQIAEVYKRTVRVRLCSMDGCYNDYVVPQWGEEATVPITYATSGVEWQNMWRKRKQEIEKMKEK